MIRHRDAEKQQRQNLKHRARNRTAKDALKDGLKSGRAAAAKKDLKGVAAAMKLIGRTASAGIIHKKKASRLVSRLAKAANRAAAEKAAPAKTTAKAAKAPKAAKARKSAAAK